MKLFITKTTIFVTLFLVIFLGCEKSPNQNQVLFEQHRQEAENLYNEAKRLQSEGNSTDALVNYDKIVKYYGDTEYAVPAKDAIHAHKVATEVSAEIVKSGAEALGNYMTGKNDNSGNTNTDGPPTEDWELTVSGGRISSDTDWDSDSPPDAKFIISVAGKEVCSSWKDKDTHNPVWNQDCSFSAPADTGVTIMVVDADYTVNDPIGQWSGTVRDMLNKGSLSFEGVEMFAYSIKSN